MHICVCVCVCMCVCVHVCVCVHACVCIRISSSEGLGRKKHGLYSKRVRVREKESEGEGERESKRTEENRGVAAFQGSQHWQVSPAKEPYENRVRLQRKPDTLR